MSHVKFPVSQTSRRNCQAVVDVFVYPCSRTKPHSHKPIEICTTLSNECQPLLVHHIFVSGVRVQRRSICAFTIIIALLWREPFLKSPSDFLARLSLFQNFILHLQIASHGQATKYVLQLFGVFFLVLRLDPVQQMFLFFSKLLGLSFRFCIKRLPAWNELNEKNKNKLSKLWSLAGA